ncbi:MAG TPA: hypothetical protein VGQ14_03270, partial [Candidatus Eisenbacteria bacterium]|nr:hypothetical protein [Candidatus Eisenbacteria bacterium]
MSRRRRRPVEPWRQRALAQREAERARAAGETTPELPPLPAYATTHPSPAPSTATALEREPAAPPVEPVAPEFES